eukprot:UN01033
MKDINLIWRSSRQGLSEEGQKCLKIICSCKNNEDQSDMSSLIEKTVSNELPKGTTVEILIGNVKSLPSIDLQKRFVVDT